MQNKQASSRLPLGFNISLIFNFKLLSNWNCFSLFSAHIDRCGFYYILVFILKKTCNGFREIRSSNHDFWKNEI